MASEPVLTSRGAATRERLLRAAQEELTARDGTLEVASVAARADVSAGLLYRYFGSKAGLVGAVVDDFYDRLHAEVADAVPPGEDWAARERARLELSVAFHYREPLATVVLSRLLREPEVAGLEARRIGRLVEDAAKSVARSQRRGELPPDLDPRTVGAIVIGAHRVAMGEALTRARRPAPELLVEQLWRFMVAGVGLGTLTT